MPIEHSIWRVGAQPEALGKGALPSEQFLEDMIVASPEILSDEWMIIGRQVNTGICGRIDLLAVAPDGAIILIELKRDRTPWEVVGQTLDYASWLESLHPQDIARIYSNFSGGRDLAYEFQLRFGSEMDEDTLNESHQIVIVASSLDASSERVVNYLNDRDIAINILFFQVFDTREGQLLSRAWLLDPIQTQVAATSASTARREREPWNGEVYVSYGHSETRSWEEALKYGFICGGGGTWYSGTLKLLKTNDRVWVKAPGYGFVGVGRVTGEAVAAADFQVQGPDGASRPALEVLSKGTYHREHACDPARSEYFVPVQWLDTVPLSKAVQRAGMFGNQNTVCRPTTPAWSETVERLKQAFPRYVGDD
jgi:hypothetical protein